MAVIMVSSAPIHELMSAAATPLKLRMSARNPAKASNMVRSTLRGLWLWPDVALEFYSVVIHRLDHAVEALSDHFALSVEGGVSGQTVDGNRAEGAELYQSGGEFLEKQ